MDPEFQMHQWRRGPKTWDPTGLECFRSVAHDGEYLKCGWPKQHHVRIAEAELNGEKEAHR